MTLALAEPSDVRIITTLGHVDHGKTTLMDALLAANNIISHRMAGKMKYLDSREDEQERGITMESSAVSLKFTIMERDPSVPDGRSARNFVVNMIDTPGHVDFSSEVSTASRLCDGALVLVDVVEGVCTQTIAVLKQARNDRLRPVLVVNKFDRLITELKLSPMEAYNHLSRLIEQVNAVMGSFFAGERMEDDLRWREERERRLSEKKDKYADEAEAAIDSHDFQEKDDEDIYFSPEKGNVIFASALDGWGFRVGKFAQLYSAKLGIKESNLRRVLWGDFYLDPKTKRVISYKHLRGRVLKPLFVQFVLDNIWAVYDSVILHPDPEKTTKIVSTLGLKIAPRDLKSKDNQNLIALIFSQWLSLSTTIIQAVIDVVPPPTVAQATRIPKILYPDLYEATVEPKNRLEKDLFSSNSDSGACISAYVSKMFAVPEKDLPENKKKPITAEEMRVNAKKAMEAKESPKPSDQDGNPESLLVPVGVDYDHAPSEEPPAPREDGEVLLGFARIYSGTLSVGKEVFAVLPKYDEELGPANARNAKYLTRITVEGLYVMMGRELLAVGSVRAGNIFAIKGLGGKVFRNATLCSPDANGTAGGDAIEGMEDCLINMGKVHGTTRPIVRVALEPVKPSDLPKLITGIKLLSQADPCVETFQQQTGEYVILTAGELHLERCLKDLRERFAKVEIQASKPIVPFRETAVKALDMAPSKTPNAARGTIRANSSNNLVSFTMRAVPLPEAILEFMLDNVSILRKLERRSLQHSEEEAEVEEAVSVEDEIKEGDVIRKPTVKTDQFWEVLKEKCDEAGGEWKTIVDGIWSFGPQSGGCILIDARKGSEETLSLQRRLLQTGQEEEEKDKVIRDVENHFETGFQLAVSQGPLCAEPVQGFAYFVDKVEIDREKIAQEIEQNRLTQLTGSLVSVVRDSCRNGLLDWSPRLMLAIYSCDIQCTAEVLGKVYGVVAKRRGRIVAEEMKEGTSIFTVSALLPVVESFGFADDIRKRTSGAASPQLIFQGYELLDQDPFWTPTTEEELEDLGEKADKSNIAKGYMDEVRARKGMFVDRKIVEFAEKQRTLKH